jgi:hypothetical protein
MKGLDARFARHLTPGCHNISIDTLDQQPPFADFHFHSPADHETSAFQMS